MADVTPASNASDYDVIGAAEVLDSSSVVAASTVWTPEVVARVTTIVAIMAATLTGNVALIAGITCHAALRRRRISAFLVNLAVGQSTFASDPFASWNSAGNMSCLLAIKPSSRSILRQLGRRRLACVLGDDDD